MQIDLVYRFAADARRAHQACCDGLGMTVGDDGLRTLSFAARRGAVAWRGTVVTPDGVEYAYHVHGGGYSFVELPSGKHIRFDVLGSVPAGMIGLGLWKFARCAESVGEPMTQQTVLAEFRRLSEAEACLVRVQEHVWERFYYAPHHSTEPPA